MPNGGKKEESRRDHSSSTNNGLQKMTMPIDLVLVRHGESEGNAARRSSLAGDNSVFTEEFCGRHNSRLRLTDRGREQARVAGTWLKEHISPTYDRYLVSGYLRAMETASLLDLPEAVWYQEFYLRERDLGLFEIMPEDEKKKKHPEALPTIRTRPVLLDTAQRRIHCPVVFAD
jgi:NAD+ kinase